MSNEGTYIGHKAPTLDITFTLVYYSLNVNISKNVKN